MSLYRTSDIAKTLLLGRAKGAIAMTMRWPVAVALLVVLFAAMAFEGPSGSASAVSINRVSADDAGDGFSGINGKIAFASERDGNYEIYVMDADGSNPTNLTNDGATDGGPAWSPDGGKIAFTSERDGNYEIYVMDADGSNPTNLTNNSAWDSEPAWSPDGSKIAFESYRDNNREIYVMNADGTAQTNLTNNALT